MSTRPAASAQPASFAVEDWRERVRVTTTPLWKQAAAACLRPLLAASARRRLAPGFLDAFHPDLVLGERGLPLEARRRLARPGRHLRGCHVWVQGTGTGWDVLSWAALHPDRITATDLFEFEGWESIARCCFDEWGVRVAFRSAPLEDHAFLETQSVDICGSDAVFEHCRDFPSVVRESYRVLRSGGKLFATYGPMWFSAGGDHFSGRGGETHHFAHVEYEPSRYREYFLAHRAAVEDFQSGGRYVELDLFSKLTTAEYLKAFAEAGFAREWLALELSAAALRFRARFPDRFRDLAARLADRCAPDDLVVKANFIRLRR